MEQYFKSKLPKWNETISVYEANVQMLIFVDFKQIWISKAEKVIWLGKIVKRTMDSMRFDDQSGATNGSLVLVNSVVDKSLV